jgi:lysophospholipase L1-like esterase
MEFVPNCSATWNDAALSGKAATRFRTNAIGLRDEEIADDGAVRILALGDSCTWGWQVPQDEAYPQDLQRLLDQRYGPHRYRVINAGIPGYTSYQGLIFLRDVGLELHPAIVIIGFGFNDASHLPNIEASLARQRALFRLIRIDDALLAHSTLWRWLRTQLGPAATTVSDHLAWFGPASARAEPPTEPMVRVSPAQFVRNLTAIVDLCRTHGAKVLLLSFAGSPRPEQPYADAIGKVATAMNVPLVVYDGPRIDLIHPAREGYAALSATLLERLESVGDLGFPSRRPSDPNG